MKYKRVTITVRKNQLKYLKDPSLNFSGFVQMQIDKKLRK